MENEKEKTKTIEWEAQEYITHDKNAGWYIGLAIVGIALVALSIWLRWWTFMILVILCVISLLLYVVRPPRKIKYSITQKGLVEGNRTYNFEDYRAFGILQDDTNFAIAMMPRKRFSSVVTVYFPKEKGEDIVDEFGARLPMEPVKLDLIDRIVRRLRI